MVQSKKRKQPKAADQSSGTAAEENTAVSSRRLRRRSAQSDSDPLTLHDYIMMNAAFAAFCIVQLIIVRLLLRDFAGLYFFFGFIVCAFMIASAFDYFSEKLNMGVAPESAQNLNND